ncbi:g296 [Coccomyxa elongata]
MRSQVAPDEEFDWAARYEGTLRTVPLAAGALGIVGVLVNRLVSGIAPVVDASSAQSRADVLVIGLSAVLVLTGLQWLSLKPKPLVAVEPDAEYVSYIDSQLPEEAKAELQWLWRALRFATRCRGVVAFHKGRCIMHCGMAAPGTVPGSATVGPIGAAAMKSGSGNYLANLILFPGRVEFTEYLPENTQGVLVQPIGEDGLLVCGTDTQRGFGRLDQAWIAAIAEKLDIALRESEGTTGKMKAE